MGARCLVHTIGTESQVFEKVVGVGLAQITSVKVQPKEGNAGPKCNLPVNLVDERLNQGYQSRFSFPCPISLLTSSSLHVHRASGLNRCKFSYRAVGVKNCAIDGSS